MATVKIRSNVYLDAELKENAQKLFKSYGLSLSDGLNILLRKATKEEFDPFPFEIEPINSNDPDYKFILEAREQRKNGKEEYISFDEFMKL